MRKKIILSIAITVIFSIIISTISFLALDNINRIKETKEILGIYNKLLTNEENIRNLNLDEYSINGVDIRFTIIDKKGTVLFDTLDGVYDNHSNRKEIIDAFLNGNGMSVRYSENYKSKMVYVANKYSEDIVLRSSFPIDSMKTFNANSIIYYFGTLSIIIFLSTLLGYKLIKITINPIKELEVTTNEIANGDLNKRAKVYSNDEIGSLANTFNNMAEQLQVTINDSFNKQGRLEAILESMDSGVIALDNKRNILLINSYSKKIFELEEEIIGERIDYCILDYDLINFIKCTPNICSTEIKLYHPIEREIKVKKAPIVDRFGKRIGSVISLSDISDIKKLENMRSQFVANVSHELKTPLTSIKGFAETLKYVDDKDTKNKFLDIINDESERLSRLINDILVLSNIENLHKMKEEKIFPIEIVNQVVKMVLISTKDKSVNINVTNNFNGYLLGEKDKFYQVIVNLIENAIKYSEENSDVNININIYKRKKFMFLEITDNGVGIPFDDLPRIFERFYRVDKSRATKGTGLGLAIVKHIIKLFNGEIQVESKVNQGSKFIIKIKINS